MTPDPGWPTHSGVAKLVSLALLLVMALVQWKVRAEARVVPRHFGRLNALGFGGSMLVALVAVMPVLNTRGGLDGRISMAGLAVACAVIALPSCVASLTILKRI